MRQIALLVSVMGVLGGCNWLTELKSGRCDKTSDCRAGEVCDERQFCVCAGPNCGDGGSRDVSGPATIDGAEARESGVSSDTTADASGVSSDTTADASGVSADTAAGASIDGATGDASADATADMVQPGCKVNGDCSDARPACSGGVCVECATSPDCKNPGKAVCVANACVECGAVGDCKDPARAFCVAGACVGCDKAGATACAGLLCAPADTAGVGGQCVKCLTSAGCSGATPICSGNACTACTAASQCLAKNPSAPACSACGTCVQCADNTTCSGTTPVCDTTTNMCVQCTDNTRCSGATPICSGNVCTACTAASQCAAKNPAAPACSASGACVQ